MKKIFISQPMRDKTVDEIVKERYQAIEAAEELLGEKVDVIDSYYDDMPEGAHPLDYIARSISDLAKADVAVFVGDWRNYRGCRIEHQCAVEYGIDRIDCFGLKTSDGVM